MDDPSALLRIVAGGEREGFFYLRALNRDGSTPGRFVPLDRVTTAADWIGRGAERGDVFVGAAPRAREDGTKRGVERAWCLWVDCDTLESVERLADMTARPSLVVSSGTGPNCHAWWSLTGPIPAAMLVRATRRLAHHLGADMAATDAARIMRPPGSLNHKHDPPRPVTVLFESGVRHGLADLVGDLQDPPGVKVAPRARRSVEVDDLLDVSPLDYVPLLSGREVSNRGKVQCPFHGNGVERTPSLVAHSDPSRGWYCYGCREGGNIYSFAAKLWGAGLYGVDFLELKARLRAELGV